MNTNTQAKKLWHLRPLLVGGIAAILVSGIALGSLAISAPDANRIRAAAEPTAAATTPSATAPKVAEPAADARRCAECGVIESTQKIDPLDEDSRAGRSGRMAAGKRGRIDAKPLPNYEITIRLRDGSVRVIKDAHPAIWRHGERVTIIAGAD